MIFHSYVNVYQRVDDFLPWYPQKLVYIPIQVGSGKKTLALDQVSEAAQRKKRRWWDPRHHGFQYSTDLGKL